MKSQVTEFLRTFNLKHPIIQSPMAGASTIELAATITGLHGLGSIPLGDNCESPELVKDQLDKFKSLVSDKSLTRNVNVNFFAHDVPHLGAKEQAWTDKYKELYTSTGLSWSDVDLNKKYNTFKNITDVAHPTLKVLAEIKPRIVSFHFGLPNSNIIQFLQKADIKVFVSVTNLEEFKQVVSEGVDGVVLQGWEAGGHRGNFKANDVDDDKLSTEDLVKQITEYIQTNSLSDPPFLVAAGGIHDTTSANTLLSYGIAAVHLGTIWLPTSLATISSSHRDAFKNPQGRKTIVTPAISGRNLRTIESDFLNGLSGTHLSSIPDFPVPYSLFKQLNADAKAKGLTTFLPFLAGANFDKSWKGTDSASEVFQQLANGLKY